MGDEGRLSRRQPSSTRHSSMQRIRPRPRASNQSLQSQGRPQETTFTSFEPFSPPSVVADSASNQVASSNGNGRALHSKPSTARMSDAASIRSASSSKRSRSIFAPNRENSITSESRGGGGGGRDGGESSSQYGEGLKNQYSENIKNQYGEGNNNRYGDGTESVVSEGVSQASRSLHAILMDQQEHSRIPLFSENLDTYHTNPQVIADLNRRQLAEFINRKGGVAKVIKKLGRDLAEKDAEISMLRKKNDVYAFVFKEHLTTEHGMSRLEADKQVQTYFPDSIDITRTYSDNLQEGLGEAIDDNPFGDQHFHPSHHSLTSAGAADISPFSSSPHLAAMGNKQSKASRTSKPSDASNTPKRSVSTRLKKEPPNALKKDATNTLKRDNPNRRSFIFGMRNDTSDVNKGEPQDETVASPLPNDRSRNRRSGFFTTVVNRLSTADMMTGENVNKRASFFASASSPKPHSLRTPSILEPLANPSLEMERKLNEDYLPPSLLSMGQLIVKYPDSTFDSYGFIIDVPRIFKYIHFEMKKHGLPLEDYRKILTFKVSESEESNAEPEPSDVDLPPTGSALFSPEPPTKTWYEYLKASNGPLLSRMPTLPRQSGRPIMVDDDSGDEDFVVKPSDYGGLAEKLRDETDKEYSTLQHNRVKEWHELEMLMNASNTSDITLDSSKVGIASLATSQHRDHFVKFVLGGIPMTMRSKVWLENVESKIHYGPDDFEEYKASFIPHWSQFASVRADINSDKGRTLTNNVFFRSTDRKDVGRSSSDELASILRAFVVRNPSIGYIQGFNLIAGYLMLAVPTAEHAFWIFTYLIEHVLPPGYLAQEDRELIGPRTDAFVLRHYIDQLLPTLAKHMEMLGLPRDQTVPINWLITAFASTLNAEALYRVWDVVFSIPAQNTFLLNVALALLKVNEEKLLKANTASQLYHIMDRGMGDDISIDGLIHASWALTRNISPATVEKRRKAAKKELTTPYF